MVLFLECNRIQKAGGNMSTYEILVSHGGFAEGLGDTLKMFVGERNDVLAIGLKNGEDVASFGTRFSELTAGIHEGDEIILLGDLIGGSPLTTAINCLQEKGLLAGTVVLGGMNLAMALTAALSKDGGVKEAKENILKEAASSVKEFVMSSDEDDDI